MNTNKKKSLFRYGMLSTLLLGTIGAGVYEVCKTDGPSGGIFVAETTVDSSPILKEGYVNCRKSVSAHGAALERAILARGSRVEELADDLTGFKATWKTIWNSKAEVNEWMSQKVKSALYDEQETSQVVAQATALVVKDWMEQENIMADKLGRPVIGEAEKGNAVALNSGSAPQGMNEVIWKQLMYTIGADVGAEILASVATNMAVTTGILSASAVSGWATFGISTVVGGVVAILVNVFTDPTPEIEAELNKQLAQSAASLRAQFEQSMFDVLNKRAQEWK